jgi:hypothetical protein
MQAAFSEDLQILIGNPMQIGNMRARKDYESTATAMPSGSFA